MNQFIGATGLYPNIQPGEINNISLDGYATEIYVNDQMEFTSNYIKVLD